MIWQNYTISDIDCHALSERVTSHSLNEWVTSHSLNEWAIRWMSELMYERWELLRDDDLTTKWVIKMLLAFLLISRMHNIFKIRNYIAIRLRRHHIEADSRFENWSFILNVFSIDIEYFQFVSSVRRITLMKDFDDNSIPFRVDSIIQDRSKLTLNVSPLWKKRTLKYIWHLCMWKDIIIHYPELIVFEMKNRFCSTIIFELKANSAYQRTFLR